MTTPGNSIWEQELRASVDALLTEQLRNLQGRVELRLRQAIHESLDDAVRETVPQLAQDVGNRLDQWNMRVSRSRIAQAADPWPEWLRLLLAATRPAEALQALLYSATSLSGRAAIFILRSGQASVWRSSAGIRLPESLVVRDHELLRRCVEQPQRIEWNPGAPPLAPFPPGLGNASSGGIHPLRVHAKTIGFLYWEQDDAGDSSPIQQLDLLVQITGLILQSLTPALSRPAAPASAPAGSERPAPAAAESAVAAESAPAALAPSTMSGASAESPAPAPEPVTETRPSAPAAVPARSATMTPLQARAHRFAKVLIQDLEIYLHRDRPGVLAAARQERNIYGRLRDELERARKSFWEKFPPASGIGAEVLEEAVILLLCDGDHTLMGPEYPGLKPYL